MRCERDYLIAITTVVATADHPDYHSGVIDAIKRRLAEFEAMDNPHEQMTLLGERVIP